LSQLWSILQPMYSSYISQLVTVKLLKRLLLCNLHSFFSAAYQAVINPEYPEDKSVLGPGIVEAWVRLAPGEAHGAKCLQQRFPKRKCRLLEAVDCLHKGQVPAGGIVFFKSLRHLHVDRLLRCFKHTM
jgi:hypothetical protein